MDVLLHVPGQVEVDDVLHVGDVQTSGRHRRRHDDRGLPGLESKLKGSVKDYIIGNNYVTEVTRVSQQQDWFGTISQYNYGSKSFLVSFLGRVSPPERLLALALRPVPVDAGDGEPFPVEELIQRVRALLSLNEDQSSTSLQF